MTGRPVILDASGRPMVRAAGYAGAYRAADVTSHDLELWRPVRTDADSELQYTRPEISARARDLARNNGWASGLLQREIDSVVGAYFRLSAKPDWRALGLSEDWAAEWSEQVEAAFRSWAEDPRCYVDDTRTTDFSGLLGLAYRHYLAEGDALAVLGWREDRPWSTTVRVVDPDLLSNPSGTMDSARLRSGIRLSAEGAPAYYCFASKHPMTGRFGEGAPVWQELPRETPWGRPVVVHFFDRHRDGQTRGVSRLAPVMAAFKMEDQYARVELEAATISAAFPLFLESPFDHEMAQDALTVSDYQKDRTEFHNDRRLTVGGSRIPTLYPGEQIKGVNTSRPNAQYDAFETAVLRRLAAGTGVSYEQLAADWSKTNYSSARASLIEIWRGWSARRRSFAQRFARPLFAAWLEEAVARGVVALPPGAPEFHAGYAAYTRSKWIGPGKGFVDPVKEVQAAGMRVALGLSTLEDEAAELSGSDLDENYAEIRREIARQPDGMLHPAQQDYAKLIGAPAAAADEEMADA